ncbi:HEAT repeat domain-containing protein [Myxococcus sp. SDU36]|uniref:HEAT repeat domain-containing protein n=1 Tax=Myxococcus sp. SDU36 TaxID=2831967 RepID=UPI002542CDE7|nr:HEAT repeat domain-containing protein [Myxococcus sp. SDU36]WIG96729.1 HEAT repeat domain-containing protein [Myxococcus sp. SDU36]
MRPLLLAGLLLATAARAQAPAAPSGPAPTPPAEAAPAPATDDAALLRGLLGAVRPAPAEIRAIAIEDLALLGDARALDALATLLWDPNPRIQQAALRAVTLFQHPRAEELLANVVRHPRLPDALKIQALNGLVFQRTPTARRAVQDAAVDSRLSAGVQNAARTVVSQWDAPRR